MSTNKLNERQLALFLTEKCKCTDAGRALPRPYCDEDEAPTFWKTSNGFVFVVPPPPNGSTYEDDHIELIIKASGLNVVTSMDKGALSISDQIKDFKKK